MRETPRHNWEFEIEFANGNVLPFVFAYGLYCGSYGGQRCQFQRVMNFCFFCFISSFQHFTSIDHRQTLFRMDLNILELPVILRFLPFCSSMAFSHFVVTLTLSLSTVLIVIRYYYHNWNFERTTFQPFFHLLFWIWCVFSTCSARLLGRFTSVCNSFASISEKFLVTF